MAYTSVKIAGVPIDETRWDWPIYRGAFHREITLPLTLAQYQKLRAAIKRAKGIVDIDLECSGERGADAPKMVRKIKGVRVIELVKNNELTCSIRMADARIELSRYVAVSNIRIKWRDGFVDGTDVANMEVAVRRVSRRALHLFADDAFDALRHIKPPEQFLAAGAGNASALDYVLSKAGADLWCSPKDGLLRFANRTDIGPKPIKKIHAWVRSRQPGWETGARDQLRLPKVFRFYYKRKHMLLVPLLSNPEALRPVTIISPLTIVARQIYFDDGFSGTTATSYLTQEELFAKYGISWTTNVAQRIADAIMSQNFDDTPIQRDGSRNFDTVIRILKRDWQRLFRLEYIDPKGAWGSWTDLTVGIFKTTSGRFGALDDILAAGVRGNWTEFLNIVNGSGPNTIIGQKTYTNHDDPPTGPAVSTKFPTMPFAGTFESVDDGILRLNQQQLPDSNFAMPGLVSNHGDMTIKGTNTVIPSIGGKVIASRWSYDLPTHDLAKLTVEDMYLLIVGTQRWPNDAAMLKMHEVAGFADGNVDFQEFEVPELPALYDFVDDPVPGKIDFDLHPAESDNLGKQINEPDTLDDAETRAAAQIETLSRKFAGEGVAAGLSGLDEKIEGSVNEIVVQMDGVVVTTAIRCENLATDTARKDRAQLRARARRAKIGSKGVQSV